MPIWYLKLTKFIRYTEKIYLQKNVNLVIYAACRCQLYIYYNTD